MSDKHDLRDDWRAGWKGGFGLAPQQHAKRLQEAANVLSSKHASPAHKAAAAGLAKAINTDRKKRGLEATPAVKAANKALMRLRFGGKGGKDKEHAGITGGRVNHVLSGKPLKPFGRHK